MVSGVGVTVESPALRAAFREVMAGTCTPVSVVTATAEGMPYGTTVSAFSSLSIDPPMVLVALDRNSGLLAAVGDAGRFGVNVLASGQSTVARSFARKGLGKFTGCRWVFEMEVPRIPDVGGFLACRAVEFVRGGDHVVVLGRVLSARAVDGRPLTYFRRSYGTHVASEPARGPGLSSRRRRTSPSRTERRDLT